MERTHCQRCGAPATRSVCARCERPALTPGRDRACSPWALPLARQELVGARASVGPDTRFGFRSR